VANTQPKLSDMSPNEAEDENGLGTGLPTLHLEHHHLQKLGLKGVSVGDKVMVHAMAHVVSRSQHENKDGEPSGHMSLDLHKMAASPMSAEEPKGDEAATSEAKSAMDKALTEQAKPKARGKRPISEP
jgi:hypothetical protein